MCQGGDEVRCRSLQRFSRYEPARSRINLPSMTQTRGPRTRGSQRPLWRSIAKLCTCPPAQLLYIQRRVAHLRSAGASAEAVPLTCAASGCWVPCAELESQPGCANAGPKIRLPSLQLASCSYDGAASEVDSYACNYASKVTPSVQSWHLGSSASPG